MTIFKSIRAALAWLALVSLSLAAPAAAQGNWTVGDQGADWTNPTVDGWLVTEPLPADEHEPPDPPEHPDVVEADWITAGDQLGANFQQGIGKERKLRFQCEPTKIRTEDFILAPGEMQFGHPHEGFGLVEWDRNSNYVNARAAPSSTCMGGPLFPQIYVEPVMKDRSPATNAIVARLPQNQTIYYVGDLTTDPQHETWIRVDTQFILGVNPADYNDQARRDAYAAGGFEYPGSPDTPAGFTGWQCFNGPDQLTRVNVTHAPARMKTGAGIEVADFARYLVGPGGVDPWGGNCTAHSDSVPALLIMNLIAPGCWDATNLTAFDGRGHFWHTARKPDNSVTQACPRKANGAPYVRVPVAQFKSAWAVRDFDDYKNMHLASDRMNPANAPGDPTSKDPCRQTGPWFCNGATAHADWGYGAKRTIFEEAMRECLGIPVRGIAPANGTGAECNSGQISRYRALRSGSSPDPTFTAFCQIILQCYDSRPANPRELYKRVPGLAQDGLTIEHRH